MALPGEVEEPVATRGCELAEPAWEAAGGARASRRGPGAPLGPCRPALGSSSWAGQHQRGAPPSAVLEGPGGARKGAHIATDGGRSRVGALVFRKRALRRTGAGGQRSVS